MHFTSNCSVAWSACLCWCTVLLGVVRKELIIVAPWQYLAQTNLLVGFHLTVQLVVMALVAMLYIPCVSTMAILGKEFGWKAAAVISLANIGTAFLIGGLTFHLLNLFV